VESGPYMQRRDFLTVSLLASLGAAMRRPTDRARAQATSRKILIAGGNFGTPFIRYMATLTGKKRPKLLYLPTASADGQSGIITWYKNCAPIDSTLSFRRASSPALGRHSRGKKRCSPLTASHDGFTTEAVDNGEVPGIPEGQPLPALRS
jgi:hypothetical protein